MDKKKVKELIEKGISYLNKRYYIASYEQNARECFKEALQELSKSDWISVEDELPPYDEVVNVIIKDVVGITYTCSSRYPVYNKMKRFNYDENSFEVLIPMQHVTHWKPIEKLEE